MSTFGPIDAVSEHLAPAERRATAILSEALCRGGAEIAQIGPGASVVAAGGRKSARELKPPPRAARLARRAARECSSPTPGEESAATVRMASSIPSKYLYAHAVQTQQQRSHAVDSSSGPIHKPAHAQSGPDANHRPRYLLKEKVIKMIDVRYRQSQSMPVGRMNMTPKEVQQFKDRLAGRAQP